jgi:hypothetical protein
LLDLASRFKHMGISPFSVAQQPVVVHGRPAWFGQFVIALINGSGLFAEPLHFRFDGENDEYGSPTPLKAPMNKTISMRVTEKWFSLVSKAAEKLGYVKGDADRGVSRFVRQAAMERATKVLGLRPTLPVHVADKNKH